MKTILVPVDFSEYSEYALEVAASIAKKQKAEVVAVHMIGIPDSYLTRDEKQEIFNAIYYMEITRKRFKKFLRKDYLEDIDVTEAVKSHIIFSEINKVAEEYGADLVIMGSHGASGIKEALIGSNTEKVIRTSNIPVLVIKERIKDFKIEKAVFVTEFDKETANAYRAAKKFFKVFGVEPEILFINIPEKFMNSGEMHRKAYDFQIDQGKNKENYLDKVVFYNDYTAEKGVYNYCKEANIDTISIPTHGRKPIGHFFFGSMGEDIANHAKIPVITFKI
ncbi:universal stress protein [Christiangramia aquimixticola]|uniref:universal stress protein n=1 Tax=Christiangramia aquimixticola TaxID=1697558 RepID=UPI003AA87383